MNWKIGVAFLTGGAIASGIVYMAVRPQPAVVRPASPKPVVAAAVVDRPLLPPPPAPEVKPDPQPVPALIPKPVRQAPAVVREKPSPMPAPKRREEPAVVARNQEPPPPQQPSPVTPPPVREPVVNHDRPYNDAPPVEAPPPTPPAPAAKPAPVVPPRVQVDEAPARSEDRTPHSVTLAAGTILAVRIGETITARSHQPGDTFMATLDRPLVIDGFIIAERGSRVEGRVVDATQKFGVELVKLSTADGQHIRIHTEAYQKGGGHSAANDIATIGAGAAIGAAIGAAAGGGKGAAIGAGVGGAAGAAGVAMSRDRPTEIPVEARISFRVKDSVTITERLD